MVSSDPIAHYVRMALVFWAMVPQAPVETIDPYVKRLDGCWRVVSREFQGREIVSPTPLPEEILQFDGDCYFRISDNKVFARGTYEVDSRNDPVELDIHHETGIRPGVSQKGVLRLNGETLVIAFNPVSVPSRPTGVETDEMTTHATTTYVRVKR
jgi:uncharacterized protein (TIGR03067 family)